MSKIIAVLNQKGGAGKTTLSTNLARALQLAGDKVLLGAINQTTQMSHRIFGLLTARKGEKSSVKN